MPDNLIRQACRTHLPSTIATATPFKTVKVIIPLSTETSIDIVFAGDSLAVNLTAHIAKLRAKVWCYGRELVRRLQSPWKPETLHPLPGIHATLLTPWGLTKPSSHNLETSIRTGTARCEDIICRHHLT